MSRLTAECFLLMTVGGEAFPVWPAGISMSAIFRGLTGPYLLILPQMGKNSFSRKRAQEVAATTAYTCGRLMGAKQYGSVTATRWPFRQTRGGLWQIRRPPWHKCLYYPHALDSLSY